MLTVNEAGEPSLHNCEERVERGKCGVAWSSFVTLAR